MLIYLIIDRYLKKKFTWLYQVLVVAYGIFSFTVPHRIFSCRMQSLSCNRWDLAPQLGIKLRPPELGFQHLSHWITRKVLSSVQLLSHIRLFAIPQPAARQAALSIINFWSLLKLMSIKSVMPSNNLILRKI